MEGIDRELRRRRTLSKSELEAMYQAAQSTREQALFDLLRATACRVHEALAVLRQDVDIANEKVVFRKTKGKVRPTKEGGTRTVLEPRETPLTIFDDRPLSSLSIYAKDEGIKEGRRLFPMTSRAVRGIIKRLARRAGIRDADQVHPHTLRHTGATEALRLGFDAVEIKHMFGWSKFSKTFETTYAHPTTEGLIEKAKRLRKQARQATSEG